MNKLHADLREAMNGDFSEPERPERHELDPAALEMLQQADLQIRALNDQINGMLTYFAKARGLTAGQWRLSENRRELVPVQQQ